MTVSQLKSYSRLNIHIAFYDYDYLIWCLVNIKLPDDVSSGDRADVAAGFPLKSDFLGLCNAGDGF